MLEKLAAIADYADRNGHHEVANDLTYLVKNAQLFDALRTLFDPSTSELSPNDGWWRRLTRGWQKGKFDRRLGLALAINAERTKLNKKIEQLAAPLKDFSAQVTAFYDKVKSGGENYGAMDFKEELTKLKSDAAKMKNLIGGRDLRKALDMRNKLNAQQISAVEKIKGIDPEHKDFLVKLLSGEIKNAPAGSPAAEVAKKEEVPGATPEIKIDKRTPGQKAVGDWLKLQKIPHMDYEEGFSTARSRGRSAIVYSRYGSQNAFAVAEFFKKNPEKKAELLDLVGVTPFNKLFTDLKYAIEFEMEERAEREAVPQKEKAPEPIVTPPPGASTTPGAGEQVLNPPSAKSAPEAKPKAEPKAPTPNLKTEKQQEQAAAARAVNKGKSKAKEKPAAPAGVVPPIQMREQPPAKADDGQLSLAASAAQRLDRQITRLGRVRQLQKIAQFGPDFGMHDKDDPGPDMYDAFSGGRETFDEEKDYDPAQTGVEMYHGPDIDVDDEWGRGHIGKEQYADTMNSLLSKMEQFGRLWREAPSEGAKALVQKQLDRLQAEYDLLKEKQAAEDEKKLPEGWANDASDEELLCPDCGKNPVEPVDPETPWMGDLCEDCHAKQEAMAAEEAADPKFQAYLAEMDDRVAELEKARAEKRKLHGLVPCKSCDMDVRPGRMHYPGNEPDNGPAHMPEDMELDGE